MVWDFDEPTFNWDEANKTRKPVEWVSVAPPVSERTRINTAKRAKGKRCRAAKDKVKIQMLTGSQNEPTESPHKEPKDSTLDNRNSNLTLGIHNRAVEVQMLEAEDDEGNIEYKLKLKQNNPIRFQQLVTQLKFRLSEGNGKCVYYIGVEDDGYIRGLSDEDLRTSFQTLTAMAHKANANVTSKKQHPALNGRQYVVAELARTCQPELFYTDICIAVAGSEGSGKSTLVAVLSNGKNGHPILDSGYGSARMMTLRHKHEIESGKTSSLGHHTIAYDRDKRVLNYAGIAPLLPSEIAESADCILRLVDLGGSKKYLKTAFYGLTGLLPKLVLLCVCPVTGFTDVTRQHMAVALAMQIPIAVIITKSDKATEAMVASIKEELTKFADSASPTPNDLQRNGGGVDFVHSERQAIDLAQTMQILQAPQCSNIPVFKVDNTMGYGLSILHTFLSNLHTKPLERISDSLSSSDESSEEYEGAQFVVDDLFAVKEVGQVASGCLISGNVTVGQNLLLGPTASAQFKTVSVRSIERAQVPVMRLRPGQSGTILYEEDRTGSRKKLRDARHSFPSKEILKNSEEMSASECDDKNLRQVRVNSPVDLIGDERNGDAKEHPKKLEGNSIEDVGQNKVESLADNIVVPQEVQNGADTSYQLGQTDRRHDEWQSTRPTNFNVGEEADSLIQNRISDSIKGGSDSDASGPSLQKQSEAKSKHVEPEEITVLEEGENILVRPSEPVLSFETFSLTNSRKGTVLIDPDLSPTAFWEFQALMVLFGGFWPPRGLISGSWPFALDTQSSSPSLRMSLDAASDSLGRSPKSRSFKRLTRGVYTPVIHCRNVRQAARVVEMHEESLPDLLTTHDILEATGLDLSPALSAARLLTSNSPSQEEKPDICVAKVRFRFEHEPAWLESGLKIVARDHTESCLSGAGVITHLFPPSSS